MYRIISDGWSMQIAVDESVHLYSAYARGHEPRLPELPIQYADYAIWQRAWLEAGEGERQLTYWRDKLGVSIRSLSCPRTGRGLPYKAIAVPFILPKPARL